MDCHDFADAKSRNDEVGADLQGFAMTAWVADSRLPQNIADFKSRAI